MALQRPNGRKLLNKDEGDEKKQQPKQTDDYFVLPTFEELQEIERTAKEDAAMTVSSGMRRTLPEDIGRTSANAARQELSDRIDPLMEQKRKVEKARDEYEAYPMIDRIGIGSGATMARIDKEALKRAETEYNRMRMTDDEFERNHKADFDETIEQLAQSAGYGIAKSFGMAVDIAKATGAGVKKAIAGFTDPVAYETSSLYKEFRKGYQQELAKGESLYDEIDAEYRQKRKNNEKVHGKLNAFTDYVDQAAHSGGEMAPIMWLASMGGALLGGTKLFTSIGAKAQSMMASGNKAIRLLGGVLSKLTPGNIASGAGLYVTSSASGTKEAVTEMQNINAQYEAVGLPPKYTDEEIEERAALYGFLSGITEAGGEHAIGGLYGTSTGGITKSIKNPLIKAAASWLIGGIGEGVEESLQTLASYGLKNTVYDAGVSVSWREVLDSGIVGFIMGETTAFPTAVSNTQLGIEAQNAIADALKTAGKVRNDAEAGVAAVNASAQAKAYAAMAEEVRKSDSDNAETVAEIYDWMAERMQQISDAMTDDKKRAEIVARNSSTLDEMNRIADRYGIADGIADTKRAKPEDVARMTQSIRDYEQKNGISITDRAGAGTENAQGARAYSMDANQRGELIDRTGRESGAEKGTISFAHDVSSITGRGIRFYRQAAQNGYVENGYYDPDTDTVYINTASKNPAAQILAHELTHSVEGTDSYLSLRAMVFDLMRRDGVDIDAKYREKEMLYSEAGYRLRDEGEIAHEVIAEYVEQHLLTDEASIRDLAKENRTLGQRIREWLDSVLAKLGNASAKERDYVRRVRDMYANAMGEDVTAEQTGETEKKRSLVGERANVNTERLAVAKQMEAEGKSDEEIYRETGWYRQEADGKWRTELLDEIAEPGNFNREGFEEQKAALAEKVREGKEQMLLFAKDALDRGDRSSYEGFMRMAKDYDKTPVYKLPVYLNAPKLYEAYPRLEKVKLYFDALPENVLGGTSVESNEIIIDPDQTIANGMEIEAVLAHEIQHIIQHEEGFEGGTSPEEAGGEDAYWDTKGEIEARDVEDRLRMSAEDRRKNMPVRFSVTKAVEETKDLIAVHNLNADKLMKSLALGGMPMPSIAIAKAEGGHENFGEISLVFDKSTIDPRASAENKVYSGDAWTPTYPTVEYKVNDAVERRVRDKYYDLAKRIGYDEARAMYRYAENLDDSLNRDGGEDAMIQRLYDDTGMMQIYLQDVGRGKVEPIMREVTEKMTEGQVFFSEYLIEVLGEELISGIKAPDGVIPSVHRREYMEAHGAEIRDAYKQMRIELYGDSETEADQKAKEVKTMDLLKLLNDAYRYIHNGGTTVKTVTDTNATDDAIRAAAADGYREWIDGLFRGVQEKSGIRNQQDTFTKSGNRRSWEATHYETTLENVVRAMKESGEKGVGGFGGGNIFGASTQDFSSIEDMKKSAGRLQNLTEEEFQEIKRGFRERFSELAGSLPKNKDSFHAMDAAANMLVEAVVKYKTKKGIDGYLRRESQGWANYSPDVTEELIYLVNDIRAMPTQYFEAKPQRAVSFDEVAAFVIPRNADIKVKQELLNRGYSIAEYDPDVPGDRARVLNGMDKYKFSISKSDDPDNKRVMPKRSAAGTKARARQDQQTRMRFEKKVMNRGFDNLSPAEQEHYRDEIVGHYRRKYDDYKKKRDALIASGYQFAGVDDYVEKVVGSIEDAAIDANTFLVHYQEGVFGDPAREDVQDFALDYLQMIGANRPDASGTYVETQDAEAEQTVQGLRNDIAADEARYRELTDIVMSDEEFLSLMPEEQNAVLDEMQELRARIDEAEPVTEAGEDIPVPGDAEPMPPYQSTAEYGMYDDMEAEYADMTRDMQKERRETQKLERENLREAERELERQFEEHEKEQREINRRQREEDRKREIERGEIKTVSQRLEANLQSTRLERSDVEQMRQNAAEEYRMIIDEVQERYDALNNKNTAEANTLLRRIARIENRARNEEAYYRKRLNDIDEKIGRIQSEIQSKESPTEQRNMRRDLYESILYRIKEAFSAKGFDFDKILAKAKDLSTFATVDNTPQRVMEKALGYEEGNVLADMTVNQTAKNETEGIRWLNQYTGKDGVLAKLSEKYHIKPGSKESAAAQMYAEGFYVNEYDEIVEYGDRELAVDFPDEQVQKNIKGLARDPVIRQIYDQTLDAINASRTRNAYPEIQKLDNYYLHFRALDDTFSRLGVPFNLNDIRAKDLPTDLNGVTADLKPGQPYFASANHRRGKRTSFDLLGGLEKYLTSAKNQIYHIDDIQTLRALRNYIADMYGQGNGLQGLDDMDEDAVQERIKQKYDSHLSTFAKFLNEEANIIAGKTSLIDRGLEGVIGRRGITFINDVNRQVGANMVGWNISSSLTNVLPVMQAFAKTNKLAFVKGFAQTVQNRLASITGKGDGFAETSDVIVRRKGADRYHRTPWQKASDAGYLIMGMVDDISTEIIARAKYNELTAKGMDAEAANRETDKWVSRLMGDRSLGQMPQIFNSKFLGLVTKFQLEVRNQIDAQFYDTIKEAQADYAEIGDKAKRNAKIAAKVTATFAELAIAQHLFGAVFESIAGYNPAFDIIEVIAKVIGLDDDKESEDTVLDNIEQGVLALIEDLPYSSVLMDGGRVPVSAAMPIGDIIKGEDQYGNEVNRLQTAAEALPYYVLPGGYGQIKKTAQGLSMFTGDKPVTGSYTDSGNLRFPVEATPGNVAQAAVFGQWANENARDYFDNERKAITQRQADGFAESGLEWKEFQNIRTRLSKLKKNAEKIAEIASMDISAGAKEAMYLSMVATVEKDDEGNVIGTTDDDVIRALKDAGLDFDDFLSAKQKQSALNADESLSANQRASRFLAWVASEGYTEKQADIIGENFGFASGFRVKSETYQKIVDGGVTPDNAVKVSDALSGTKRSIDKINAIWSTGLTGEQLDRAIKAVLTESAYEKYRIVIDANVPLEAYTWVLDNADTNGNGSINAEERLAALQRLDLPLSELSALWLATGGSEKSNPYADSYDFDMDFSFDFDFGW